MIYQWGNCSTIHFVYQTLFTASKLKVFDVLNSSESLTLQEVAGQINASVLGTERLLEAAVSLGLLERVKQRDTSGKIYALPFYSYRWCYCCRNHMWVLKPIKNVLSIQNLQVLSLFIESRHLHAWMDFLLLYDTCSLHCYIRRWTVNVTLFIVLQYTEIQNRPVASWYRTAQCLCMATFSTAMIWCGLSSVI